MFYSWFAVTCRTISKRSFTNKCSRNLGSKKENAISNTCANNCEKQYIRSCFSFRWNISYTCMPLAKCEVLRMEEYFYLTLTLKTIALSTLHWEEYLPFTFTLRRLLSFHLGIEGKCPFTLILKQTKQKRVIQFLEHLNIITVVNNM